ncbi:hypothetical protein HF1_13700 [Mycoplasma haemofelis str. Langford 1]|uniref:Uncharacterized protein n=1 Tax=Mycoplasma haemofelis (strain Langford 1) TaxID=941640 RepID=E8ZJQ7_MYCHL|nr:hypothetical protein [Mycoplasma haemofelis]CBY93378.1 hypothetical protein HF1_13700 [Mycoplasma haemofelis str. Langford 1]
MNSLASKSLFAAVPAAGIAGTGAYFGFVKSSNSEETIRSKLEQRNKDKPRTVLFSTSNTIWTKFKELYKNSESNKKITGISESDLPNWCEVNLKKTYSDKESSILEQASSWCVANTNTLKQELELEKLTFIADNADASSWQNAWNKYNGDKEGLEINSLKTPPVNGATDGGSKLQQWCKSKLEKHMYESFADEEKTIEKVKKHCVSSRSTA